MLNSKVSLILTFKADGRKKFCSSFCEEITIATEEIFAKYFTPAGMAPPLGRCGSCNMQFTTANHAYNCVVCKRNFHPECLNLESGYVKDGSIFAALRGTNCVVCKSCRETTVAERTNDGKRPRDSTAAAADEEQIAKLTRQVYRLTEEKKIMEARILAPTAPSKKMVDELELKLKGANQKIAHLENLAFSNTTQNCLDKATLEKLSLYEKEIASLKEKNTRFFAAYEKELGDLNDKNNRLLQENVTYADKYTSLKRRIDKKLEKSTMQPGTSADPSGSNQPIVITTAKMNELLALPLKQLLKEIRQEVRDTTRPLVVAPPPVLNRRVTQFSDVVRDSRSHHGCRLSVATNSTPKSIHDSFG